MEAPKPPTPTDKKEASEKPFVVSAWPHIKSPVTVPKIMFSVVLALLPATLVSLYLFGWDAFQVIFWCVASALATEAVCQKWMGRPITINDGSASVTGLLLALTMPPASPWWLSVVGGATAIGLGKQVYGGLGYNIFNPALISRVVLLIAFPVQMTTWPVPRPPFPFPAGTDAVTGATPLGHLQVGRLTAKGIGEAANVSLWDAFIGTIGGSLGETSAVALILGGAYLWYKGYITWHIPISMVGTVMLFSLPFWLWDPTRYASPMFHLVTGGLLLGAIYMATDMVTCPTTPRGQLLFGAGCGLIAILIRMWGGYPEGVSFAVVIMNGLNPTIERYIQPRLYGAKKTVA
jgi:electron transport complex protein RnfD